MIIFFNKLGNSWIAKIILGSLALSMMAFWGLGGLTNLFTAYNNDALIVGKTVISTQQLAQAFDEERKNLSKQIGGQYISPKKALELGLLEKVIQNEVAREVKFQIKEDLGLMASEKAVQKYVETSPFFQDALGKFDKNIFLAFLNQRGISETMLAYQLKEELAYNHLRETINDLAYAPNELNKLSFIYENETRDIEALLIKPSDLKISEQPTEEDLKNYYEGYAENFAKPEYRKIKLLSLMPETMHQFIQVDENEVNRLYEAEKDSYNKPEERELLQIFFKTKEDADKAHKELTAQNFEEKALALGQTKEATNFGFTPKNQLMEELQEPVFKASKEAITEPIQSQTGWHIFYVKDIKPAEIADEATVKADIRKGIVVNQAYDKLTEISRQAEDLLGSGKTLSQTAQELKLSVNDIEFTDIAGINKKGEKNQTLSPELMQEVFTLNKGDVTSLVEYKNGFLLAEIVEVEPVGTKPFDEVKEEIVALFVSEKQKEKFETVANELLQKVQNGASLEEMAKSMNAQFIKEDKLLRTTDNPTFKILVNALFAQEKGAQNAVITMAPNNMGAIISVVHNIYQPDSNVTSDKLNIAKIKEEQFNALVLNDSLYEDYMQELNARPIEKSINRIRELYQGQE